MANWSTDTVYFGRPLTPEVRGCNHTIDLLPLLKFDSFSPGERLYYDLEEVSVGDIAIRVSGAGRWGTGLPLTEAAWEELRQGIVVWDGTSGFDDDIYRTVWVSGKKVFDDTIKFWSNRPLGLPEGKTPEERAFFDELREQMSDEMEQRRKLHCFERLPKSVQAAVQREWDKERAEFEAEAEAEVRNG